MKYEEIKKKIEDLWVSNPKKKDVTILTGRSGAINYRIQSLKEVFPDRSEDDIRKEVESDIWEDGMYEIDTITGLNYLGLFDKDHKDGVFGYKIRGHYYIELWESGKRINYNIVSKREFNRLIK